MFKHKLALAATGAAMFCANAQAIEVVKITFNFTGAAQTFLVPDGVTKLSASLLGGSGGANGGRGGWVIAEFAVTPGESLEIWVGGRGNNLTDAPSPYIPGGFNGGGAGYSGDYGPYSQGSGGGATDIRRAGEKILVVGGGGGGFVATGTYFKGGNGGFYAGGDGEGEYGGKGATRTGGGAAGGPAGPGAAGSLGLGGSVSLLPGQGQYGSYGGGGGGYYGGGAGAAIGQYHAGGGGSGFAADGVTVIATPFVFDGSQGSAVLEYVIPSVPEPATYALMLLGVAVLVAASRARARQ